MAKKKKADKPPAWEVFPAPTSPRHNRVAYLTPLQVRKLAKDATTLAAFVRLHVPLKQTRAHEIADRVFKQFTFTEARKMRESKCR